MNQHPHQLNVNNQSYQITSLLGKGKGGYSYLAITPKGKQVVLKQIHHEPCDYYQFGNKIESELKDYETLSKVGITLPKLLDVDKENERIVKEYIPGDTVSEERKKGRLPEIYFEEIQKMCQKLYPAHLNIDYFPTNFIYNRNILFYIDYECNVYDPKWDFEHWGRQYWD